MTPGNVRLSRPEAPAAAAEHPLLIGTSARPAVHGAAKDYRATRAYAAGVPPDPLSPLSLLMTIGKEKAMDIAAKVSSKGQVTVPKAVRDALGIKEGDEVVFRVEGDRAVLARTPHFLDLAGSIRVPAAKRNVAWDEVLRRTRADRAAARH